MRNSSACAWAELTVVAQVPHGEGTGIQVAGILLSLGLHHTDIIKEMLSLYGTSAEVRQSVMGVACWWGRQEKCFKLRMTDSLCMRCLICVGSKFRHVEWEEDVVYLLQVHSLAEDSHEVSSKHGALFSRLVQQRETK